MAQLRELLTTAEAARLLGVTRRQVLELAAADQEFPTWQAAPGGGRAWPRAGIQAWAADCPGAARAVLESFGADAVRQRVADVTEGVAVPEPAPLGEPAPEPVSTAGVDLAPSPLGKDPLRRKPWGSMAFQVPQGRPVRAGMIARQYFLDRDGYPVLTTDGRPVHFVVDEHGIPVLDPEGRYALGPVEVPPGATVTARYEGR